MSDFRWKRWRKSKSHAIVVISVLIKFSSRSGYAWLLLVS